jgi:hypothetical protein
MNDHETKKTRPNGPNALDYQAPRNQPAISKTRFRRFGPLLYCIGLIAIFWLAGYLANRIFPPAYNATAVMSANPTTLPVPPANITAFYRSEISPLLDAGLKRNREAADRAIALLHERFNAHRAGVRPFAEDVSGWGTRFGVMGRFVGDSWDHCRGKPTADAVGTYIQEKFRVHVLSEPSLQSDVEEVLKQYRDDLAASRNQMFAEIKLPLRGSQSPITLNDKGWDRFCVDVAERTKKLNTTAPREGVVIGLASLASGWVGTETADVIIAEVLAGVGTAVGAEAAEAATVAGGSAAVGGTAAGGGVGSLGGPAGTAIGIGVGLVIGAAVDWWASGRLEAQVADACNKFLNTVERQIVDGNTETPGLRASFEQAVKLADAQQRQAIIDALVEARK